MSLKHQLNDAHTRLAQITLSRIEEATCDEDTVTNCKSVFNKNILDCLELKEYDDEKTNTGKTNAEDKMLESPESHIEVDCEPRSYHEDKADIKFSNIVPIHKTCHLKKEPFNIPVTKVAER